MCTVASVIVASRARVMVAGWLETGALAGVWPSALGRLQAGFAARALSRPLVIPRGLTVITVGGATLGGSGKTRVALAVTRLLVERGARVALIGHAYRARPARARVVHVDDAIVDVGDEALLAARTLGASCPVIVARTRQEAIDHAATLADVVVLDGPLQLAPVRASLALLAVDADAPWGAGALPPAGDLRAPRAALLAHTDLVVPVDAAPRLSERTLDALRKERVGLFTAIGRPARLEAALRRAGVSPAVIVRAADHGPVTAALARHLARANVDRWLATDKCALHLAPVVGERAITVIEGLCELPREVESALAQRVGAGRGKMPYTGRP